MLAAPMARLQQKKQAAVTTGSAETTGIPRAMVLRLLRVLPGAPGFLATVTSAMREHRRQFDTSVGVSGPRDLTVRIDAVRRRDNHAATSTRPPHPASPFVTTAKRPSYRGGMASRNINFGKNESEIFFASGLDTVICLRRLAK
jgi:hypothetical protein